MKAKTFEEVDANWKSIVEDELSIDIELLKKFMMSFILPEFLLLLLKTITVNTGWLVSPKVWM